MTHCCAKNSQAPALKYCEYTVGRWSALFYLPVGMIVTSVGGLKYTCAAAEDFDECAMNYFYTVTVLLLLHTYLDYYIWTRIVKQKHKRGTIEYAEALTKKIKENEFLTIAKSHNAIFTPDNEYEIHK